VNRSPITRGTILFVAPQPYYRERGACMAHQRCLHALVSMGLRVELLTQPFGEDRVPEGVRVLRATRLPGVGDIPIGPSYRKLLSDIPLFGLFIARLLRGEIWAVHASEEAALAATLLKPIFGFRFVYDMDDILSSRLRRSGFLRRGPLRRLIARLERRALKVADAVLTNSTSTTRYAQRWAGPDKVVFYDHAPDLSGSIRSEDARRTGRRILYAGNLEPYQGVDLLIDALPKLAARIPGLICEVIGGTLEQVTRIQGRAKSLGVSATLWARGPLPLAGAFKRMSSADVLVSPASGVKAVPMKIYAYMQSNTPIVATDLPNHREILDDSCAVLVEPSAPRLAEGIQTILSDPEEGRRLAGTAYDRAQERLSPRTLESALAEVYDSAQRIEESGAESVAELGKDSRDGPTQTPLSL